MTFKSLNKEHDEILNDFTKEVQAFIYRITDLDNHSAFRNFKPVLTNAKTLHNNIGNELKKIDISESDWIFMFPNYMLFAGIGFAAGIKNKSNAEYIESETEQLFAYIREVIGDLENMYEKKQIKEQMKKKQKNKTKKND
tara:strand:- start:176 stop:595 length:420 start_codon:yes stop_codon:yes gene_type:complete